MVKNYYKLKYLYYKLQQKVITNYNKKLSQIRSKKYYKLWQLKFPQIIDDYYILSQFLLQIMVVFKFLTNYVKNCYKLWQLIHITALLKIVLQQLQPLNQFFGS